MGAHPTDSARAISIPVALCALAGLAAAQSTKLNGPLAHELREGSVPHFLFTADGARVVYKCDRDVQNRGELFSRPSDGSGPSVRLNGPMHPNGDVGTWALADGFAIGAGERVVYVANEVDGVQSQLFSVPADGSASRIRLSPDGVSASVLALEAAGTHVLFQQGFLFGGHGTGPLYRAPIDGSAPALLLTPGLVVHRFWPSPDGTRVVFSTAAPSPDHERLYAMPVDGSAAPLLLSETHPPALSGRIFWDVTFTPDEYVVYNEIQDFFDDLSYSVYSVPLDASHPAVLLGETEEFAFDPVALPVRVTFNDFPEMVSTASDGSQRVALSPPGWRADAPPFVSGTTALIKGFLVGTGGTLFRAPSDGSLPAEELFPPAGIVSRFLLASPTTVAMIRVLGSARQLEAVPLAGGAPLPLHPLPPAGQGASAIVPHPDGQRVVFTGDLEDAGVSELYVVPLDASSAPLRLNQPLAASDDLLTVRLAPDGAAAAFIAGPPAALVGRRLFGAPLDGSSAAFQLNEPILLSTIVGDVTEFHVSPDGARLVYRADQAQDEHFDLHALALDAPGNPLLLSQGLPTVLAELAFTPLGERVVFQVQGAPFALRVAEVSGAPTLELDTAAQAFGTPFEVSADGTRLVYRRAVSAGVFELRSVALDGQTPPVSLHAPLGGGRTVEEFRLGAGGVVAFLADLATPGTFELHAVPILGGAPVRLSQTLVAGGDVSSFELDPLGTTALYLADARLDNRVELFRVALDGSRAPRRLNGPLPTGGDVSRFALTPDARRVVYRADQVSDNRHELFSVSIDGPRPPHGQPGGPRRDRGVVRLTPLPSNRQVSNDWALGPAGDTVVYRSNGAGVFELFRVPVDGSAPPARLSAPLVAGGGVAAFAVAPDQGRVVYSADQRVDNVIELFSVPLAGGPEAALDLMPAFGDVSAFRIAPDSTHVVFLADREQDGVSELFRVPLDGHGPALKLNRSLTAGGDVLDDFLALEGASLYRADAELDEVVELFLHRWPGSASGKTRRR